MSLILDALQQAEQERRLGATPTDLFTAQPLPAAPATAAFATKRPLVWLLAALVMAAAAVGWWSTRDAGPHKVHRTAVAPASGGAAQPSAAQSTPPNQVLFTEPAPPAKPVTAAPVTLPAASASAVTAAPPVPAIPAIPAPSASGADLPALGDLPEQTRATLPSLAVSGHTYSDNPTLRSLMIDGRMFVEGQALAPGLRLERIGPHRAVFNLRGTRFGVDY